MLPWPSAEQEVHVAARVAESCSKKIWQRINLCLSVCAECHYAHSMLGVRAGWGSGVQPICIITECWSWIHFVLTWTVIWLAGVQTTQSDTDTAGSGRGQGGRGAFADKTTFWCLTPNCYFFFFSSLCLLEFRVKATNTNFHHRAALILKEMTVVWGLLSRLRGLSSDQGKENWALKG